MINAKQIANAKQIEVMSAKQKVFEYRDRPVAWGGEGVIAPGI